MSPNVCSPLKQSFSRGRHASRPLSQLPVSTLHLSSSVSATVSPQGGTVLTVLVSPGPKWRPRPPSSYLTSSPGDSSSSAQRLNVGMLQGSPIPTHQIILHDSCSHRHRPGHTQAMSAASRSRLSASFLLLRNLAPRAVNAAFKNIKQCLHRTHTYTFRRPLRRTLPPPAQAGESWPWALPDPPPTPRHPLTRLPPSLQPASPVCPRHL